MKETECDRRNFIKSSVALSATAALPGMLMASAQAVGKEDKAAPPAAAQLTLHAIDTHFGQTHAGLRIDLARKEGDAYKFIKTVEAEPRGRTKDPLLVGDEVVVGRYELLLHLDDYFAKHKAELPKPPFLNKVPIRFGIYAANQRFHVPILFNPWSYSYYRGS